MIRFVFRWVLRLVLLLVLLVVIFIFSLDPIVRVVMEHRIRAETGMDAEIGRVSIGLIEPRLEIRDLKLFNPPSYGGTLLIDIPEFHVEYDPIALGEHKLHLTLVRLNLGELDIVKNEAGQTNIFALGLGLPAPAKKGGGLAVARPAPGVNFEKQTGFSFASVDVLNVSVGTVKFIDLHDQRHNRTQKIDIENCVVKNVKTPADLAGISVMIALRSGDFFTSLAGQKNPANAGEWLKMLY